MTQQQVLVFTKVGEDELHVGKCSHAQARILVKKGHGRIEGSKLFINLRPVHLQVASTMLDEEEDPNVSQAEKNRRLVWLSKIVAATNNSDTNNTEDSITDAIRRNRQWNRSLSFSHVRPSVDVLPLTDEEADAFFRDVEWNYPDLDPQMWLAAESGYPSSRHLLDRLWGTLSYDNLKMHHPEDQALYKKAMEEQTHLLMSDVKVVYTLPSDTVAFSLNGREMEVHHNHCGITYEQVCKWAGENPAHNPTLTYRHVEGSKKRGTLTHGESLLIQKGTVINCMTTGNA